VGHAVVASFVIAVGEAVQDALRTSVAVPVFLYKFWLVHCDRRYCKRWDLVITKSSPWMDPVTTGALTKALMGINKSITKHQKQVLTGAALRKVLMGVLTGTMRKVLIGGLTNSIKRSIQKKHEWDNGSIKK
jgi:hypothetical protein